MVVRPGLLLNYWSLQSAQPPEEETSEEMMLDSAVVVVVVVVVGGRLVTRLTMSWQVVLELMMIVLMLELVY